eukprot:TRINITY_DN9722_c0_g1_i8.p2 TRINITY_DN9722_c0_g1~~TRINITY_DN9722_c0_g1_i8.p2  ORF type:complete len:190 (-),score=-11.41 TRINITY_DN9722_c0_g1_i8:335-904(-)
MYYTEALYLVFSSKYTRNQIHVAIQKIRCITKNIQQLSVVPTNIEFWIDILFFLLQNFLAFFQNFFTTLTNRRFVYFVSEVFLLFAGKLSDQSRFTYYNQLLGKYLVSPDNETITKNMIYQYGTNFQATVYVKKVSYLSKNLSLQRSQKFYPIRSQTLLKICMYDIQKYRKTILKKIKFQINCCLRTIL